jgi:hypothetical protein
MGIATFRLHRQRHYGELADLRLSIRMLAKLYAKGLRTRELLRDAATRNQLNGFDPPEIEAIRSVLGLPKGQS